MAERFTGVFTQQEPIPEAAIAAAVEVMRSGRLHRYNIVGDELSETAALEVEFAASVGTRYALAVASGGYAMQAALRALGVGPGDLVLSNGFTLAPVPGAIASVGAQPVLVEATETLKIDLDHLAERIETTGAKVLLLSHMRGHICDMDALMALCDRTGVIVVEDCAHTMGGDWKGKPTGTFGKVGCFSTQTYKHVNSGEGGLLVTDDAELMARAVITSGSYMLYERHAAAPPREAFEEARYEVPNISGRMDNLRAAILRPQLAVLDSQVEAWNARYRAIEEGLAGQEALVPIPRDPGEAYVGSSIQFLVTEAAGNGAIEAVVARAAARGVELKWFGAEEPKAYTSRYDHWRYAAPDALPNTDAMLARLLDMRIPLSFSVEDCRLIACILREEAMAVTMGLAAE